jgi:hypothetical protein
VTAVEEASSARSRRGLDTVEGKAPEVMGSMKLAKHGRFEFEQTYKVFFLHDFVLADILSPGMFKDFVGIVDAYAM